MVGVTWRIGYSVCRYAASVKQLQPSSVGRESAHGTNSKSKWKQKNLLFFLFFFLRFIQTCELVSDKVPFFLLFFNIKMDFFLFAGLFS